jgi:hypothetical protein
MIDRENILKQDIRIIEGKLLTGEGYLRHDPVKLARTIFDVYEGR